MRPRKCCRARNSLISKSLLNKWNVFKGKFWVLRVVNKRKTREMIFRRNSTAQDRFSKRKTRKVSEAVENGKTLITNSPPFFVLFPSRVSHFLLLWKFISGKLRGKLLKKSVFGETVTGKWVQALIAFDCVQQKVGQVTIAVKFKVIPSTCNTTPQIGLINVSIALMPCFPFEHLFIEENQFHLGKCTACRITWFYASNMRKWRENF